MLAEAPCLPASRQGAAETFWGALSTSVSVSPKFRANPNLLSQDQRRPGAMCLKKIAAEPDHCVAVFVTFPRHASQGHRESCAGHNSCGSGGVRPRKHHAKEKEGEKRESNRQGERHRARERERERERERGRETERGRERGREGER